MDDIPIGVLLAGLAALLVASAFFSIAETAMMAVNRYRLRHRATQGGHGARLTIELLARTDRLLGVILLGSTLVNSIATTLTAVITVRLWGRGELALMIGSGVIALTILTFSEILPKVVGAAYPDRIAPVLAFALAPLLKVAYPAVWGVNVLVRSILHAFGLKTESDTTGKLSQEELRSFVLEGQYFRGKHRAVLANLLDVDAVTVDDVMTPRSHIEALDIRDRPAHIAGQIATSYHTRLPVYEDEPDNIIGILHLKHFLPLQRRRAEASTEDLRSVLRPPYFVPAGTPLLAQLQQFQTSRERLGLVVDEYGELLGLVTLEDILEEIVGDFTTQGPGGRGIFQRDADGSVVVDGMASLRLLNRKLETDFPLEGPKTLSGLIVEHLGDIPEAGIGFALHGERIEILQVQDRAIRVAKLVAPVGRSAEAALQAQHQQASSIR